MQVLTCYQPPSDPVTFAPKQEPLVIFSAGHTVCVATTQRSVEVYQLNGERCDLVQTFSTAGLVKQGVFNTAGNYIAVLEVRDRLPNQATNVRIYSNWEASGTDSPVKARVAGQAPSNSNYDTLHPQQQFELIELPLRMSPKCLNCCLLTGNVVVGLSTSIALFKFVVNNKGTDTEYKDFTHLLDIIVGCPIKEVALTQLYVAFTSDYQLHCFRLTFGDSTQDVIGVKASPTKPQGALHTSKNHDSTSLGQNDQIPTSHGQDANVTWNFGSAGYTVPETFMRPAQKACDSSILLASVEHEKLYHEDAKDPVEILGPKEKVKGHPIQVKWNEVYLYSEGGLAGCKIRVSITHLLYRKFIHAKDSIDIDDNQGPIHSLQLLPTFRRDHDEGISEDVNPLGSGHKTLQSLCCFISTTKDGYLYDVLQSPSLLSQYSYKADALSVRAGHSLLYALTQNGLEIYTLRSFAAAFQQLDAMDENILASPAVNLDVCMIGLLPWISITHLSVSVNHITLLSKTKQPTSPSYRNSSLASLKSWNIQILRKTDFEEIFDGMLSLGQRYQKSSKEAYLQLLQEGHLILKGALLLSMDANEGEKSLLNRCQSNSATSVLQQLFMKTCALLAQYYSRPDVENTSLEDSHLAIPYFKMSQLSLQQIIQMFSCQEANQATPDTSSSQDEDDGTSLQETVVPGPGLIGYLDDVLFDVEKSSDSDVDEELCHRILEIYEKVAPSKVAPLILLSSLKDSLSPNRALETLQRLNSVTGYKQNPVDLLALVWLYLQLGDLEQANTMLGMLNIDEISDLLANHPELLYQQDKNQLTFLAQLIRQQEPESLFEAMIQLLDHDKLRLTKCALLLQNIEQQSVHDNSHHRQFLELILAQKRRHQLATEAMVQLANIYVERLKTWKPPTLPRLQSSRHSHIPRGSGCYGNRPAWLDSLPPFKGKSPSSERCQRTRMPVTTPRLQSASMLGLVQVSPRMPDKADDCPCCCCNEDLFKLQSLLSAKCCHTSVFNQVLQAVRESTFRGSSSLNILCLDKLDPGVALGILVDKHMGIVLDYAVTTFNGDVASWTRLLQLMLMVARESWMKEARKEDPVVLKTLKGVLEHSSNLLEPRDFIKTLPNDGLLTFFTPYLEQSCRKHKVKLLQTQALTMVKSDDTRS